MTEANSKEKCENEEKSQDHALIVTHIFAPFRYY